MEANPSLNNPILVVEVDKPAWLKQLQSSLLKELKDKGSNTSEIVLYHFQKVIDFDDKDNLQRILSYINQELSLMVQKDFRFTLDVATAHAQAFLSRDIGAGSYTSDYRTYPILSNKGLGMVHASFHLEKVNPPKPQQVKLPQNSKGKLPQNSKGKLPYNSIKENQPQKTKQEKQPLNSKQEKQPQNPKQEKQPQNPKQEKIQPKTFLILVFKVVQLDAPKTRQQVNAYIQSSGIQSKEKIIQISSAIWATYESHEPKSSEEEQRLAVLKRLRQAKKNQKV